jgi:hypothetical protein
LDNEHQLEFAATNVIYLQQRKALQQQITEQETDLARVERLNKEQNLMIIKKREEKRRLRELRNKFEKSDNDRDLVDTDNEDETGKKGDNDNEVDISNEQHLQIASTNVAELQQQIDFLMQQSTELS